MFTVQRNLGAEAFTGADGKQYETDDSIAAKSVKLAALIRRSHADVRAAFPLVVYLPKGGLGPLNVVARVLGYETPDLYAAAISTYPVGSEQAGQPRFGQMPSAEDVAGKRVLVIDEVCDSGKTLTLLTDLLRLAGAAAVSTAVLHYKPEKSVTGLVPDWYVEETNAWVVYPWEQYELPDAIPRLLARAEIDLTAGTE